MADKILTRTFIYNSNTDVYDTLKAYNSWGDASDGKVILYGELNISGSPIGVAFRETTSPYELYRIVPSKTTGQPANKGAIGYRLVEDSNRSTNFVISLTATTSGLAYVITAYRNNLAAYDPHTGDKRYMSADTTVSFQIKICNSTRTSEATYTVTDTIPKNSCYVSGTYSIPISGYYFGDKTTGVIHTGAATVSGNTGTSTVSYSESNRYHAPTYVTLLYTLKDSDDSSDASLASCDVSMYWDYIITSQAYLTSTLKYYPLSDMSTPKTVAVNGTIPIKTAAGTDASFMSSKYADVGIWGTYESNTDVFSVAPKINQGNDPNVFLKSYSCINKSGQTTPTKYPIMIKGTFDASGAYSITLDSSTVPENLFSYVASIDVSVNDGIQTITTSTLLAGGTKKTITGTISPFKYWGSSTSTDVIGLNSVKITYSTPAYSFDISMSFGNLYPYSNYIGTSRIISCNIMTYPNTYAFENITSTSDITAYSVSSNFPLMEAISGYLYIPLEDKTCYKTPWTLDETHDTYSSTNPKFTLYTGVVPAEPILEIYTTHAYTYTLLTPTVNDK